VLALIAIVTVVVISAWKTGGSSPQAPPPGARVTQKRPHTVPPLLTVVVTRGSVHVIARSGSATGNVAYDGTIEKGHAPVAIRGRRLWVQIDSPENLRIHVRGKLVHVPGLQPRVIVVTPTGWHSA
jgi:hypothetical protein